VWILARWRYRRTHDSARFSPAERALAEERCKALLHELLNEREYQQLMQRGYVEVASPSRASRVYRIPSFDGRVCMYEHGRPLVELCVRPEVALPRNDVIVLHKLMIQGNEQGYLAQANKIELTLPPRFYE
ncbi:MAG: hypothetical protein ACRDID_09565, partial [Ktedonobacterales bacterium]